MNTEELSYFTYEDAIKLVKDKTNLLYKKKIAVKMSKNQLKYLFEVLLSSLETPQKNKITRTRINLFRINRFVSEKLIIMQQIKDRELVFLSNTKIKTVLIKFTDTDLKLIILILQGEISYKKLLISGIGYDKKMNEKDKLVHIKRIQSDIHKYNQLKLYLNTYFQSQCITE